MSSSSTASSSSKSLASPVSPSFPSPTPSSVAAIPSANQTLLAFHDATKAQVIFSANPFISHPLLVVPTNNSATRTVETRGDTDKTVGSTDQNDDVPSSPSSIMDSDGSLFMVARILADLKSVKQDHPNGSPVAVPPCSSPSTTPTSTTVDDDPHQPRHIVLHRSLDDIPSRRTRAPKGCTNRYVCSYPGCGKMYGKYQDETHLLILEGKCALYSTRMPWRDSIFSTALLSLTSSHRIDELTSDPVLLIRLSTGKSSHLKSHYRSHTGKFIHPVITFSSAK